MIGVFFLLSWPSIYVSYRFTIGHPIRTLIILVQDKDISLKLLVGVSPLQLVNLHRNRRYFVIKLHTWFVKFSKMANFNFRDSWFGFFFIFWDSWPEKGQVFLLLKKRGYPPINYWFRVGVWRSQRHPLSEWTRVKPPTFFFLRNTFASDFITIREIDNKLFCMSLIQFFPFFSAW
jgi:hypothetical protein